MGNKPQYRVNKMDLMKLAGCRDLKKIELVLEKVYLEGLKAQAGEDYLVDSENRYLHVARGTKYTFVCPFCNEETELDFETLLDEQGGIASEDIPKV